ncbi:hypothetical protein NOC27_2685 [Nitrosococcus oceani AFC27]|nr:hypothetical protein NOC27_2685 [Nitrosococcus oceani AFC27]
MIGKIVLTIGLFPTNINADIFTAWVAQDLLPKLPPQSVSVMDNATLHQRQDTQAILRKAAHTVLYLPPYSPDLNPIEQKGAHTKAIKKQTLSSIAKLFKIESSYL